LRYYLFGLGTIFRATRRDTNIARPTAAGHWLPLQSAWDFMRNTKPPLLFCGHGGWWLATTDAAQPALAEHCRPGPHHADGGCYRGAWPAAGTDHRHAGAHPATLGYAWLPVPLPIASWRPMTSARNLFTVLFSGSHGHLVALLASRWKFCWLQYAGEVAHEKRTKTPTTFLSR
jgi:hypothetical protein